MEIALPVLAIDLDRPEPLTQQIADGIRVLLVRGELRPGDQLPSSRRLAKELAVHFNTVAAAYRTLESEGWLALRRRSGTVVLERFGPKAGSGKKTVLKAELAEEMSRMLARYEARGISNSTLLEALESEINRRKA